MIHSMLTSFLEESSIVAVTDRFGRITYVNDQFCKISKYSREELMGQNHRLLKSGYHDADFYKNLWKTISSGQSWRGEICNRAKDGSTYWVDSFIKPYQNSQGVIESYYSFRIVVSKKKEIENDLQQERNIFVGGNSVVFKWKNEAGWPVSYVSENVLNEFGYSPAQLTSESFTFSSLIHPDDLPRVISDVKARVLNNEGSFDQEYRIRDSVGDYRWVSDFTVVNRESDGTVTSYYGYIHDISEDKQKTEQIQSQSELIHTLIESIPDAIFLKDQLGRWLVCNPAGQTLFNLHGYDWLQKTDKQMGVERPHYAKIHEVCRVNDTGAWAKSEMTVCIESLEVNGVDYEFEVYRLPIFNSNGSPKAMIVLGRDMTIQNKAFAKLIEQNERLERIAWKQSHEVRSPVARILGLVNILQQEMPELKQNDIVKMLKKSTNELDSVVRAIVSETLIPTH